MDNFLVKKFEHQLQELLLELNEMELVSKEATATVVLDQSSIGRLSRMDAMQGQQMAMASERRRIEQISQIKAALIRIQENEFGYCLHCEEQIPIGRLDINPATTLCVKCAK